MSVLADYIIYDDGHLLVLNKPPGVAVQSANIKGFSIESILKKEFAEYHLVNRLDQPASGLIMVGLDQVTAQYLSTALRSNSIIKHYIALVEGHINSDEGVLADKIIKRGNKAYVAPNGKPSLLHYRVVKVLDRYTYLGIELKTGRFHQIRCQLANMGHPIKGDVKYGARRKNKDRSIYLHARSLKLVDYPSMDANLVLKGGLPENPLWKLLESS